MRTRLVALVGAAALLLVACGSDSANEVASLVATENTPVLDSTADAANGALDDEAAVMAFSQCMRDQGIEYEDPLVDAAGNVQKPALAEGVEVTEATKEKLAAPYETCSEHLEGVTFGGEGKGDVSGQLDQFIALAVCLRERGFDDVEDPIAETLDQWQADFKGVFNFKDADATEAYEACSGGVVGGAGSKP